MLNRRSTAAIEAALWLLAIAAMLPYSLSSVARAWYTQVAQTQVAATATAQDAPLAIAEEAAAPSSVPGAEIKPDTQLWSENRKRTLARLLPQAPAEAEAVLLLPGRERGIAVFDGATEVHMTLGAGRLLETSPLDGNGNIALSAHRDGAFRALKDLAVGDQLRLRTGGRERVFEVATLSIVKPDAVHVLEPTPVPTLTLITCYPFYFLGSAPDRYVVQARLLESRDADSSPDGKQHDIQTASLPEQTTGARP